MKPFSFRKPKVGAPRRSAKNQILADWRGVDYPALSKERIDNIARSSQLVDKVLKDLNLEKKQAETEIMQAWNSLIDANITAHAQPAQIRNGTLFVNVDSPVWKDEIVRYQRHEILRRLQAAFGKSTIQRISFRIG